MTVKSIPAHQLRIGDIIIPDSGPPRRVVTVRLEGPTPVAVVAFAGMSEAIKYPAGRILAVSRESSFPTF